MWYKGGVVEWCCRMVHLLVAACWLRKDICIPRKWTFSILCTKIGHKLWFNVIITTFENWFVLRNYIILLITIFDTTYKGEKHVEKYLWALYHGLVLLPQSRNCFRYVPDNDIEGEILGWTPYKIYIVYFIISIRHYRTSI